MSTTRTRTRRPAALAAAGTVLAAGLVLAAPLAASAHVTVTPDAPVAGGYDVLTFAFSHGCDGSPTTALQIDVPEGLDAVSPTVQAGWAIDVERNETDGLVSRVTYTADEPVENDLRATIELGVAYAADAPETLAFPVEQICADGATSWTDIAAEGQDPHDLDYPAPVVTLAAASSDGHDGQDGHGSANTTEPQAPASEAAEADPLPLALGAGGLLAGVAALAVSFVAWRRSARR
ncbi:YcnI family protein [Microbacterium marinilacus]|uniref:YncI copper-binding domain-containing protein n=1 Tax=Microbacterium marinilacus TaxID=415209 RepID=A0ABP7B1A1_9MICO|nr:YcnI family protein [Microbacterium marinilacus]MBY0690096.1 YcnI family protein [Microbacterium marinilacus]